MIRNVGLDLLKIWMCFEVILCHFGQDNEYGLFALLFDKFRVLAVPVFMTLSFFFASNWLNTSLNMGKLRTRIMRIYIPMFVWAIIYFIILGVILCQNVSWTKLLWQMTTGHSLNPAMWFNSVLIILTCLYFAIYKLAYNHTVIINVCLIVIAFLLEYKGINAFFKTYRFEISYPLGRLIEMIPYASGGLLLHKVVNALSKRKEYITIILISIFLLEILLKRCYFIHLPISKSFDYGGIALLLRAVWIVALFYIVPFDKCPDFIQIIIKNVAKYTMGIYCIHLLMGQVILECDLTCSPFVLSIMIFAISYLVVFGISRLPISGIQKIVE